MKNMFAGRVSGRRSRWILFLIALIALPVTLVTAQQGLFDRQSPATGHAQVVTQGISELPEGEVVWRLVERSARTRDTAKSGTRVLGFILATEDPVLLTNVTDDGNEDVARLAPGESYLVKAGTRQIRASMTDHSVNYLAYELVPAADANDTNGGTLLFVSDPFVAPTGARDIDLVRNILAEGETATLPDTGESVAILATEGAIDILPAGGSGRTVEAGEGAIFEPGELEITAATPGAGVGAVRAQLAAFTSSLQGGDEGSAAYVVAVIGPEIPPVPVLTQEPSTATAIATIEVAPTISASQTGSISVTVFDCPDGMTEESLVHDGCELSAGGFDLLLNGPAGELGLGDAVDLGGTWVWKNLPLGAYGLHEMVVPDGFATYFIPGSDAVFGSAAGGYAVIIDESAPEIILALYHFRPFFETGSISVNLYLCPRSQTPTDYSLANCSQATGGFEVRLVSVDYGDEYTMAAGFVDGASVSWSDLRLGNYYLFVDLLPDPWYQYVGPDGGTYTEGQGGMVELGGASSTTIFLDLPAFEE